MKIQHSPSVSATANPSQPSVSPNSRSIADAESAEQQIVSKLVPHVNTIANLNGKGNSSFAGQDLPSKCWKGKDDAKIKQ